MNDELGMEEVIEEFVLESQEHLADIENELLEIEGAGADIDQELVNKVFRSVHSVKGAAGFLGFETLGRLAHSMENVLGKIRGKELVPDPGIIDVLLEASDILMNMLNDVHASNDVDVSGHIASLQAILDGDGSKEEGNGDAQEAHEELRLLIRDPDSGADTPLEVDQDRLRETRASGKRVRALGLEMWTFHDEDTLSFYSGIKKVLELGEVLYTETDFSGFNDLETQVPDSLKILAVLATEASDERIREELSDILLDIREARIESKRGSSFPEGGQSEAEGTLPASGSEGALEPGETSAGALERMESESSESPGRDSGEAPPLPASKPPKGSLPSNAAKDPTSGPRKSPAASSRTGGLKPQSNIRVSVEILDQLMNLAGELVLSRNQLLQCTDTKTDIDLKKISARLDQVTSDLQESIMCTRMQQIDQVFSKFHRVVRDLSGKLGKKCRLVLHGEDVELDKAIIEAIGDPLTHLVRNSIDHGIELPELRVERGKDPTGTVTLRAYHAGGKVIIEIEDDGAGIDTDRLTAKALEKGILTQAQAENLTNREALDLIFHPGFSTASKVTDVSGRGVGMDVVKTNIKKLGGEIEIRTEPGAGTTLRIKLPLTLAIIASLVVECGSDRFVIPQESIRELVRLSSKESRKRLDTIQGAAILRLRERIIPLIDARRALAYPAESDAGPGPETPEAETGKKSAVNIIVVETGSLRYGLIVDRLLEAEEIVVKPLGKHLGRIEELAGATILGDGTVALILDIAGIAAAQHLHLQEEEREFQESGSTKGDGESGDDLLLFRNDPTEQFAVPLGLVSRIDHIPREDLKLVGQTLLFRSRGESVPVLKLEDHITAKPCPDSPRVYIIVFKVGDREFGIPVHELIDIQHSSMDFDQTLLREPGVLSTFLARGMNTRFLDVSGIAEIARPWWFESQDKDGSETTRILLVEDSNFFRSQLTGFLEEHGIVVQSFEDGSLAWEHLCERGGDGIDLIITDIEMPKMDGFELTRRIKEDPRFSFIPVIALTSLSSEEDKRKGRALGLDDYNIKLDKQGLLLSIEAHRLKGVEA